MFDVPDYDCGKNKELLGPEEKKEEKEHGCRAAYPSELICRENRYIGKGLVLTDGKGIWVPVIYCPFCGEKG